jgi:2-polyprenyl-3-methyl-5-hydroxy-6-metoxy-1,4-benzoquinol methylase
MDSAFLVTRCKICDSSNVSVIQNVSVENLKAAWKRSFGLEISFVFKNIETIEMYECSTCHLIFFLPDVYPSSDSIYSELAKFDWYYMPRKWEYSMALMDIENRAKILEIGCGAGYFLKEAHEKRGVTAVGIDLNEAVVQRTQRQGLQTYCMDIEKAASLWPDQFDAVCSFQVLEHVKNPKDFLLKAVELIRPGGKLILGTPNADSFLKNQFSVLDMPPHHLTKWNSRVVSHLPSSFPLSVHRIKEEPLAHYHVRDYLESRCKILKWPSHIGNPCSPQLRNLFARFLVHSRIHRLLKGHTLYVSFRRN